MIAFLISLLAGAMIYWVINSLPRAPAEPEKPADFDLFTASEHIDRIENMKDALHECEALQTVCEMSSVENQVAVTISWTDEEEHDLTVFLCGDFTADRLCQLAMREAEETRGELAAEVMQTNRIVNGEEARK